MTRGRKSSERRACYDAFYAGLVVALYGLYKGVDLGGLALLVGAVGASLMWYAGNRTAYKIKQGEQ